MRAPQEFSYYSQSSQLDPDALSKDVEYRSHKAANESTSSVRALLCPVALIAQVTTLRSVKEPQDRSQSDRSNSSH